MKQIVDPVPLVPLLHDVVPQMVEQLVDFLAPLDFRVAKQVIEVPKIVSTTALLVQSSVRRRRQNSWWKCRRSQHMHWQSLPCRPLGCSRLQWHWRSRSGQSSSSGSAARWRRTGYSSNECGADRCIFLLVEVSKVFSQARVLPHRVVCLNSRVFSFFSPMEQSAGLGPHLGSELSADRNPSTLSGHQMPPEQLVDMPVPQVPERSGNRQLLEVLSRCRSLEEEEEVDEDEEEEEVEGSRFLPHFRPRRWCWYVRAGGICPRGWQCTFAHQ